MPQRIQLSRQKGFRLPAGAKKVDRTTRYDNPFKVGDWVDYENREGLMSGVKIHSPRLALNLFEALLIRAIEDNPDFLEPLRARDLACWCKLPAGGEPDLCHAAILLKYANR